MLRPTYYVLAGLLLAACEDQGNAGDDNLLTGATGLLIVLVVGYVVWRWMASRSG